MTLPALAFGALLASLVGALYHLIRDGGVGRLFLFIALCWIGFAAGQWLAIQTGLSFGMFGTLHLGPALIISLVFLLIGDWISKTGSRAEK